MPFREKFTWVSLLVTAVAASGYGAFLVSQASRGQVAEIAYQVPMVVAVGVTILLTAAGTIVFGIGGGIAAAAAGDHGFGDLGRVDDRDREIALHGRSAGSTAAAVGSLLALALAMTQAEHFWIANTIYLSFVASSMVSAVVRLAAYRRAF